MANSTFLTAEALQQLGGRATATWSELEERLAGLFQILTTGANAYVAFAVFYAPPNTTTRLEMLDAAAEIMLEGSKFYDEWTTIKNSVTSKLRMRNRIAHLVPTRAESDDGTKKFSGFYVGWLHPNFSKDYEIIAKDGIRALDLEQSLVAAKELSERIAVFSITIRDALWARRRTLSVRRPLA